MTQYTRKTEDEWRLWLDYGQGWEHECSCRTYCEARNEAKPYRKSVPQYPRKITGPHRVRKEQFA